MDLQTLYDQTQCALLSLPAEIRNQIWHYILVHRQEAPVHPTIPNWIPEENAKDQSRFCANILLTCKRINEEGTPILYGENLFLSHTSLLASHPSLQFVKGQTKASVPPVTHTRVIKLIRRHFVYVRLDIDPRFSSTLAEESFNGCDELHIQVFQSMYGSSDFTVLKLFEGVRGVGKATIDGSLGDRKYADWLIGCMQAAPGKTFPPFYERYVGGVPCWDAWTLGEYLAYILDSSGS